MYINIALQLSQQILAAVFVVRHNGQNIGLEDVNTTFNGPVEFSKSFKPHSSISPKLTESRGARKTVLSQEK